MLKSYGFRFKLAKVNSVEHAEDHNFGEAPWSSVEH